MTTQAERLARMEEQVRHLNAKVESHDEKFDEINKKLDDILALRNKGAGVFWLMSTLFGTGLVGMIYKLFGGN